MQVFREAGADGQASGTHSSIGLDDVLYRPPSVARGDLPARAADDPSGQRVIWHLICTSAQCTLACCIGYMQCKLVKYTELHEGSRQPHC